MQDSDERTALMYASANEHVEVVKELLRVRQGVDPVNINVITQGGITALMIANDNDNTAIVELLKDEIQRRSLSSSSSSLSSLSSGGGAAAADSDGGDKKRARRGSESDSE